MVRGRQEVAHEVAVLRRARTMAQHLAASALSGGAPGAGRPARPSRIRVDVFGPARTAMGRTLGGGRYHGHGSERRGGADGGAWESSK